MSGNEPPNIATRPSRRRDKAQLSCTYCRNKKLRCDRSKPCESCVKRGLSSSCTYLHSTTPSQQPRRRPLSTASVHGRINHLEELVVKLMRQGGEATEGSQALGLDKSPLEAPSTKGSSPKPVSEEESYGVLSVGKSETSYFGSGHWKAILDDIAELKNCTREDSDLSDEGHRSVDQPLFRGPELLLGINKNVSLNEILAAVPPRPVADLLINSLFHALDMHLLAVHGPTFRKEYERFWEDPSKTPIMWIALLFAKLCLSSIFEFRSGQSLSQTLTEDIQFYKQKAVECLRLGDFTKPSRYTIEALMIYFACEHFSTTDSEFSLSLVFGIMVRVAMRAGYHRDPIHYPELSVFDGEMRRRNFAALRQVDVALATQFGLPRMINDRQTDIELPSNLLDDDFDENVSELPPPRSDPSTALAHAISRLKLLTLYGSIVDRINSTELLSYGEVMDLDGKIQDVQGTLPCKLYNEGPITAREVSLQLIFNRMIAVLHRPFLLLARSEEKYAYSRRSCLEAAMRILALHRVVGCESQIGGRWNNIDQWKFSSFQTQDFLLGAMIICLELDRGVASITLGQYTNTGAGDSSCPDMLRALEDSYELWCISSASSVEAKNVSQALRIMLRKVKTSRSPVDPSSIDGTSSSRDFGHSTPSQPLPISMSFFPETIPNMTNEQNVESSYSTASKVQEDQSLDLDALEGMISSTNIDWNLFDQCFGVTQSGAGPTDIWGFMPPEPPI